MTASTTSDAQRRAATWARVKTLFNSTVRVGEHVYVLITGDDEACLLKHTAAACCTNRSVRSPIIVDTPRILAELDA